MKRLVTILILGISVFANVKTASSQVIDPRYESIFIYQFTKYIEWPPKADAQDFVIGVLGKGAIFDELQKMAKSKTVNGKTIIVKLLDKPSDCKGCNILFVSRPRSNLIPEAVIAIQGKSILLITESKGGAKQGAGVNFILVNNRIKFEINRTSASQANLKIRSSLLKLAKIVG